MSRPEITPTPSADVKAAAARLDRSLRRLRLTRADRRRVVEEVAGDLQVAAAEGIDLHTLIGADPDAFAREAAAAGGYRPRPGNYGRLLLGGAGGALLALVAGYLLIAYAVFPFFTSTFDLGGYHPVLGAYVFISAVALAGTLGIPAVLALLLRERAAARATLVRAALLIPAVAALGVVLIGGAGMGFASSRDAEGLTLRVLLVALLIPAALLAARIWALRSPGADQPTGATPLS